MIPKWTTWLLLRNCQRERLIGNGVMTKRNPFFGCDGKTAVPVAPIFKVKGAIPKYRRSGTPPLVPTATGGPVCKPSGITSKPKPCFQHVRFRVLLVRNVLVPKTSLWICQYGNMNRPSAGRHSSAGVSKRHMIAIILWLNLLTTTSGKHESYPLHTRFPL